MFAIAILIGIFSYIIFALGLIGLLYVEYILAVSAIFVILSILYFRKKISFPVKKIKLDKFGILIISLITLQGFVNLIGVFGPEIAFDPLWYHLTIPKIFLQDHSIHHIAGNLLYYSDMPKLTDLLYIIGIAFKSEEVAKLIHFGFGILTIIAIYKLSRKFLSQNYSLLVSVLFYSNLVVAWESITSYVDLSTAFFQIMALWGFINFMEKKEKKWLIETGMMIGLSISTKTLSLLSLLIFIILLFFTSKNLNNYIKRSIILIVFSLLIPLPWFAFSFFNTGNPFSPFFTNLYQAEINFNPLYILDRFIYSPDPISPIYLISIPLIVFFVTKFPAKLKIVAIYSFLALITWLISPKAAAGRYILPFLPAFSLLVVFTLRMLKESKIKYLMILLILFVSIVTIFYRGVANKKYIPVILGFETKKDFLIKNLNYSFGDFYDTDNYFKDNIKKNDKVLIYGTHNLYYVDFPFIHESYVKMGDTFNYIMTQNIGLPERFSYWNLVYKNDKTGVKLYTVGGQEWVY